MSPLHRWSILFVLPALGAIACSSPPPAALDDSRSKADESDNDDKDDEDNTAKDESEVKTATTASEGQSCGGDEKTTCKSGLTCIKASGSSSGTCRAPGEEGDTCGGDKARTCKSGLTCRTTKSGEEGTCRTGSQGAEGDTCGGTEKLECKSGLTCVRSSRATDAEGLCKQDDDEGGGEFCSELSRCCKQLDDMFTRLSCVGAVTAGNDAACGVAVATFCGNGGFGGFGDFGF